MKKTSKKFTIIPGLLSITASNRYIHYFSLASNLSSVMNSKTKVNVTFNISKKLRKPKDLIHRLDFFWGNTDVDQMYYEHPIIFNLKAKMLIDFSSKPSITVNRSYQILSRFKFENVWPPGIHLMNLSIVSLLKRKNIIIHAGALATKKGKGVLLFGASNTGKSYTVSSSIKHGYHFMSEDLIASDGKSVFACPLLSTYSTILPTKNFSLKLGNRIAQIPFLGLFLPRVRTTKAFEMFIKKYNFKSSAEVKYIFILERKRTDKIVSVLKKDEAYRKILNLNRMELTYFKSDLIYAYSYFNSKFNLQALLEEEQRILKEVISKSKCYLIQSDDPSTFFNKVNELLENE